MSKTQEKPIGKTKRKSPSLPRILLHRASPLSKGRGGITFDKTSGETRQGDE
jgi:hypothetical protein